MTRKTTTAIATNPAPQLPVATDDGDDL